MLSINVSKILIQTSSPRQTVIESVMNINYKTCFETPLGIDTIETAPFLQYWSLHHPYTPTVVHLMKRPFSWRWLENRRLSATACPAQTSKKPYYAGQSIEVSKIQKQSRPERNVQIQNLPTYSTDRILLALIPTRENRKRSTGTL